jgi:hypothetical protein
MSLQAEFNGHVDPGTLTQLNRDVDNLQATVHPTNFADRFPTMNCRGLFNPPTEPSSPVRG